MKEGSERHSGDEAVTKRATFDIGGYSAKVLADQDAIQLTRPDVFQNRSGLFPDPRNFRLAVKPLSAVTNKWPAPPSPMNTFYVRLTVEMTGTLRHMDEWVRRVTNSLRAASPAAYGSTSERARHLAQRGAPAAKAAVPPGPPVAAHGGEREEHLAETGRRPPAKEGAKGGSPAPAAPVKAPGAPAPTPPPRPAPPPTEDQFRRRAFGRTLQ